MNAVTLKGQISRIYEGARNNIVTLYVKGRKINFPQIVFTGKNKNLIDGFEKGDYVEIAGVFKTRGVRQEDDRILHMQFIRGEEISIIDNVEEGNEPYENDGSLTGEIVRAIEGRNMVSLLVRPDGERFNLWAYKYVEDPSEFMDKFTVGSRISAKCEIQTARKEINGEVKFFENLVIKEEDVLEATEDTAEEDE